MLKKIMYVLIVALVVIQFIKPTRNLSAGPYPNDVNTKFAMSDNVSSVFKKACYDCHSNNTAYPWYANVQPAAWFLARHVTEGKKRLNFNEFASYNVKKQRKKLDEISESVTEGWMPLSSYTLIHKDAKLTVEEINVVKKWCEESLSKLPAADPQQQSDNQKKDE